jgi:creatinine amidohydrolase
MKNNTITTLTFSTLTSEEVNKVLDEKTLFIPFGTIEQHGPHLPLSVDCNIPEAICSKLAQQCNGIVAPTISYGARSLPQSGGGHIFPGTIYVRGEILIQYYFDILTSFIKSGAKRILILNGHYENEAFIFEAFDLLRERELLPECKVIALSWWSVVPTSLVEELFDSKFIGWHAEHASLVETSLMMYLFSSLVNSIRVNHDTPQQSGIMKYPVIDKDISCRGVLYRTTEANANCGEIIFNKVIEEISMICVSQFSENLERLEPIKYE